MPNDFGLYNRAELREMVRRRLDALRPGLFDDESGEESEDATHLARVDPIVSNQDLNAFLNSAIAQRVVDLNLGDETLLADETLIDIEADTVEYTLPEDLISLRALKYKPSSVTLSLAPLSERREMHYVDEDGGPIVDRYGVPTYRRRLNLIVLNSNPPEAITGGILVDYIKWLNPMLTDDAVLETQYARLLQEVIILDVTIESAITKLRIDPAGEVALLQRAEERLNTALGLGHRPRTIRLAPRVVLARSRNSRRIR